MQELIFSGENRKCDLVRLQRQFDDVAAAAQGMRPGDRPEGPLHRVVLVHAERGLGKTRLAMELYRLLTRTNDPERYWPREHDELTSSMSVTPAAERCNYDAAPGFVWWGLAVADGANPGNTVFNALEDLLPHLTAAQLATRRRQRGRDLGAQLGDLAVDMGIEVGKLSIEVAGETVGYGPIKRIGQAVFKIGTITRKHLGDKAAPLDASGREIASVVDSVLDDLSRVFSPRSRLFVRLPLVILVDDAQFADRDPAMAAFLEKLIARSAREGWPLLLILTHWSRQLRRWDNAEGVEQPRSSVADLLRHLRDGAETTPGPFAGQPGGVLTDAAFTEIDLREPVADLRPALLSVFPSLTGETAEAVVERSGGNPRKLEQIIERMVRKPRWFEGGDPARDLTAKGREAVLALADLPIDEIVLERFMDTPAGVRRALLAANLMGNRFVVDLVDRLVAARFGRPARPDLEEGETRYRFLRDVIDRSRNDIAFFSERLFMDAAGEYRTSGLARRQVPEWPEDRDLYAALDALLNELLDDPDRLGGLSDDDRAQSLSLAAERFSLTGSPRTGLALAHLVATENGRGNFEGAYEAASHFIEGFRE